MVSLTEPNDDVTDDGEGLEMDEAPTAVGAKVAGGEVEVGHGVKLLKELTQVQNAE